MIFYSLWPESSNVIQNVAGDETPPNRESEETTEHGANVVRRLRVVPVVPIRWRQTHANRDEVFFQFEKADTRSKIHGLQHRPDLHALGGVDYPAEHGDDNVQDNNRVGMGPLHCCRNAKS
jgi:hypothetical protein